MELIINALFEYIKKNSDIPRPACIIKIIDKPAVKLDTALYIQIKKNMSSSYVFVDDDEKKYCREYEKQQISKMFENEETEKTKKEIENYRNSQLLLDSD